MTKLKQPPKNSPWLTPYMLVSDIEKSLEQYRKGLGCSTEITLPGPDGKISHASMLYQGKSIMMMAPIGSMGSTAKTPAGSNSESPISFYIYCLDVDAQHKKAVAAGMLSIAEPEDMFWGDRMSMVADRDGYRWTLATNVGEFDESKMPG